MNPPLKWTRAYPSEPGFYQYRVLATDETEVIHCYKAGEYGGKHRYGWGNRELLLGKRLHDPQGVEAAELSGYYLCTNGTRIPVPLGLEENGQFAGEDKPKKVSKKKASKKKKDEQEASDPVDD